MCVFFSFFFGLQVCVNAACVPAETFHSLCIILSVGSSSLLLSYWVWDERVCVCAPRAPPLLLLHLPPPRILHSARLGMRAQAPHCAPFLRGRVAINFECFVREKGSMCHRGGRLLPKYTRAPARHRPPLPWLSAELPSNKRGGRNKRRSHGGKYSEPNLSGGPLSRQR